MDITLEPVPSGTQSTELISPAAPAVYVDAPSQGRFGTLSLPAGSGVVVNTADAYNNHAPSGDVENGVFKTIIVGAGRTLKFATDGIMYYYGATPTINGTIQNKYGATVSPADYYKYMKPVIATYCGDWSPADCIITNIEVAMLQQAIAQGQYLAYMDTNSDGVLNSVDVAKVLANYATQPGCAGGESLEGGGGMDESGLFAGTEGDGVDDGAESPVGGLAAWLVEQLPPEDLAAFVAQASVTAAAHAGDAIGTDMAELLSYLE